MRPPYCGLGVAMVVYINNIKKSLTYPDAYITER